jgi:hypothetical protein
MDLSLGGMMAQVQCGYSLATEYLSRPLILLALAAILLVAWLVLNPRH